MDYRSGVDNPGMGQMAGVREARMDIDKLNDLVLKEIETGSLPPEAFNHK